MITLALIFATVGCVGATVLLLGALRRLAEVQLAVASGRVLAQPAVAIQAGVPIGDEVLLELQPADEGHLIALLSDTCPRCVQIAEIVSEFNAVPVAVAVLGEDVGVMRSLLSPHAVFLSKQAAVALATNLGVKDGPVLIVESVGRVQLATLGESILTVADVESLVRKIPVVSPENVRSQQ